MTLKNLLNKIKEEIILQFPSGEMRLYTVATDASFYGTKESEAILKFMFAAMKLEGEGLENTEIPQLELSNLIELFLDNQFLIKGWFDLLNTNPLFGVHVNGTRFKFNTHKEESWNELLNLLGIYSHEEMENAKRNCARLTGLFILFDTLNEQYKIKDRLDWDDNPFPRLSAEDFEKVEKFTASKLEEAYGVKKGESLFQSTEIEDFDCSTWTFWEGIEGFQSQPQFKPIDFLKIKKEENPLTPEQTSGRTNPLDVQSNNEGDVEELAINELLRAAGNNPNPQLGSLWQPNGWTNPLEAESNNAEGAEELAIDELLRAAGSNPNPQLGSLWATTVSAPSNASSAGSLSSTFTFPPGGFASMIMETTPEGFCHLSPVKFLTYLDQFIKEVELPNFPFSLTLKIFFLLKKNHVLFFLKLKFYCFLSSYKSKFR